MPKGGVEGEGGVIFFFIKPRLPPGQSTDHFGCVSGVVLASIVEFSHNRDKLANLAQAESLTLLVLREGGGRGVNFFILFYHL